MAEQDLSGHPPGQPHLLGQHIPWRRLDACLPQRPLDENSLRIGIGVAALRMLPGELFLQAGVLAAKPGISAQHIPEHQQCSGLRMPLLDHMQVVSPGLWPGTQEPQPVMTARVLRPEQPARISQHRHRGSCVSQRAHRGQEVNDRLGTQSRDRCRADVLNRPSKPWPEQPFHHYSLLSEAAGPGRVIVHDDHPRICHTPKLPASPGPARPPMFPRPSGKHVLGLIRQASGGTRQCVRITGSAAVIAGSESKATILMADLISVHNQLDGQNDPLPHARLHDLWHIHATTLLLAGVRSRGRRPARPR